MSEQAYTLTATLARCTDAFNWVCAYGWEHNEKNGVCLHHATYYPVKKVCFGLVSDLVIQTRVKAIEALTSTLAGRKAQPKSRAHGHNDVPHGVMCTSTSCNGRGSRPVVHRQGQRRLHARSFAQWR